MRYGPGRAAASAGCAFILDTAGAAPAVSQPRFCNAPCRPGSAYCSAHDRLCHLAAGSDGERRRLREIEALARAVGGRQGRPAREPPPALLRRLERLEPGFSCLDRSRIVRGEE